MLVALAVPTARCVASNVVDSVVDDIVGRWLSVDAEMHVPLHVGDVAAFPAFDYALVAWIWVASPCEDSGVLPSACCHTAVQCAVV